MRAGEGGGRDAPDVEEGRFVVEPMRPGDVDAVVEIEEHGHRAPWSRAVFLEELGREQAHIDVVRERAPAGGAPRVWAFINYWLVRDEVHVLDVATHLAARRRGHAARLLGHVIAFARREGCGFVTLEVRRSNQPALRLYRRHGFRPVGVRPRYYSDEEDAIVMLLELKPG